VSLRDQQQREEAQRRQREEAEENQLSFRNEESKQAEDLEAREINHFLNVLESPRAKPNIQIQMGGHQRIGSGIYRKKPAVLTNPANQGLTTQSANTVAELS